MIFGAHYAPCWFPDFVVLFDVEGTSKEDPKGGKLEKAGKVEERLFQEKKKVLQNGMRIAPIRQVLPKLQGLNTSICSWK